MRRCFQVKIEKVVCIINLSFSLNQQQEMRLNATKNSGEIQKNHEWNSFHFAKSKSVNCASFSIPLDLEFRMECKRASFDAICKQIKASVTFETTQPEFQSYLDVCLGNVPKSLQNICSSWGLSASKVFELKSGGCLHVFIGDWIKKISKHFRLAPNFLFTYKVIREVWKVEIFHVRKQFKYLNKPAAVIIYLADVFISQRYVAKIS